MTKQELIKFLGIFVNDVEMKVRLRYEDKYRKIESLNHTMKDGEWFVEIAVENERKRIS